MTKFTSLEICAGAGGQALGLENVRGLLDPKFESYRIEIISELENLGYVCDWQILNAADFGVSQLRRRAILVGLKSKYFKHFKWPSKSASAPLTIGELLYNEMS